MPHLASVLAAGGVAVLALLASPASVSVAAAPLLSKVQYHTASGEHEAGCARSFLYSAPASVSADGSRPQAAFHLNITVERFVLPGSQDGKATPVVSSQIAANQTGSSEFEYCYNVSVKHTAHVGSIAGSQPLILLLWLCADCLLSDRLRAAVLRGFCQREPRAAAALPGH